VKCVQRVDVHDDCAHDVGVVPDAGARSDDVQFEGRKGVVHDVHDRRAKRLLRCCAHECSVVLVGVVHGIDFVVLKMTILKVMSANGLDWSVRFCNFVKSGKIILPFKTPCSYSISALAPSQVPVMVSSWKPLGRVGSVVLTDTEVFNGFDPKRSDFVFRGFPSTFKTVGTSFIDSMFQDLEARGIVSRVPASVSANFSVTVRPKANNPTKCLVIADLRLVNFTDPSPLRHFNLPDLHQLLFLNKRPLFGVSLLGHMPLLYFTTVDIENTYHSCRLSSTFDHFFCA